MTTMLFVSNDTKTEIQIQFNVPLNNEVLNVKTNTFTSYYVEIKFLHKIKDMQIDKNTKPFTYKFTKEKHEYWNDIGAVKGNYLQNDYTYNFRSGANTQKNNTYNMSEIKHELHKHTILNNENITKDCCNVLECKTKIVKECIQNEEKNIQKMKLDNKDTRINIIDNIKNDKQQQKLYNTKYDKYFRDEQEEENNITTLEDLLYRFYENASDDAKRAMNKSYIESNGTVLTACWSDVSDKKVEPIYNENIKDAKNLNIHKCKKENETIKKGENSK